MLLMFLESVEMSACSVEGKDNGEGKDKGELGDVILAE
jgi:hypothetical protein